MAENKATNEMSEAEKAVRATLATCSLPVRGSYSPGEVCKILGITAHVFWRMAKAFSIDGNGKLVCPEYLESFRITENRRVTFVELVRFFRWKNERLREEQLLNITLQAEKTLKATLAALNLPVRGSYSTNEVCRIFGISSRTFCRISGQYEVDTNGKRIIPYSLKCFILGSQRRVVYLELLDFFRRNNALRRESIQQSHGELPAGDYPTINADTWQLQPPGSL